MNKILVGDCLIKLKELEDNSVDSIVTDPPYHLVSIVKRFGKEGSAPAQFGTDGAFSRASKGFMGKTWDGLGEDGIGIANNHVMWAECLRVLKPGGHLLAFSGTRTYHRMASAIEDAGFEVRDMIEWVYGSGFPKSLNLAKSFEKEYDKNVKEVSDTGASSTEKTNHVVGVSGTEAQPWDNNEYGGGNAKCSFCHKWLISGNPCKCPKEKVQYKSEQAKQWEGWGTALKPAHEPICMARKPISEKTVAENCLKYGTGGINIDESRVGTEVINIHNAPKGTFAGGEPDRGSDTESYRDSVGRFPANLIHDNSEEVRECFPNESERFFKSIIYQAKASKSERNKGCEGMPEKRPDERTETGMGTFEEKGVAKQSNFHPTVKPIALMEYLIKMVTPKGGIVLDPFAGSGSTLVAAKQNGYKYIGIEMTEEYIPIIEARLKAVKKENTLF